MESELDTSVFEYSQMANVVSSGSFSISSSVLKWFGGGRIYYLHPNGLMLMGSFALGFLMCLVSLFGLLLATLYVLPYYVWPLERLGQGQAGWRWPLSLSRKPLLITPSTNTTTTTTTNPSSSSPLLRRGWIRVSHTPLTVAELYSSSSAGVSSSSSSSQLDSPSSTSSSDDDNDDDRIDQTWSPSSLLRRRHRRKSSEKSTSSPSSPNVINATSGNTRQLGMVEKTLEGTVSVLSSIYQSFNNQQTLSLALSGSGGGEASSATSSTQPRLRLVDSKPYRILYAELNPNNNGTDSKMLTLYSSDQPDADIVEIIQISNYKVALSPRDLPDFDLFLRDNPIHLKLRPEFRRHRHLRRHTINNDHLDDDLEPNYYIYAPSSLEKEDWYLSLQKIAKRSSISSSSVPFGSGADGFFIDTGNNYLHNHHHSDSSSPCCQIPLQTLNAIDEQHSCSMKKLVDTVNSSSIETAWLNALLGRGK